jgi:hypothetical protein
VGPTIASLDVYGRAAINRWKFEAAPPSSFEVVLRHILDGSAGCEYDFNQVVRVKWPSSIEVASRKTIPTCDPTLETIEWSDSFSQLEGTLTCDCTGKAPIAGAVVSIKTAGRGRLSVRTIRTDMNGGFRASGLPSGEYLVSVRADGYGYRDYRVKLAAGSRSGPVELSLQPWTVRTPDTLVTAGTIPNYPLRARQSGTQGMVKLRLSMQGDTVIDADADGGSQELADAAVANVRSWRFESTKVPVLRVQYSYRLVAGDCTTGQGPVVTMRLPGEVLVETIGPCPRIYQGTGFRAPK